MTSNEHSALIRYLDFQLSNYVHMYQNHVDEDVLQSMRDNAYALLVDLNITLATDQMMHIQSDINNIKKKIDDIDNDES